MRLAVLFVALTCSVAGPSLAQEGWRHLYDGSDGTGYWWRSEGASPLSAAWSRIHLRGEFPTVRQAGSFPVRSMDTVYDIDCGRRLHRLIAAYTYSQPGLTGNWRTSPLSGSWQSIDAAANMRLIAIFVCGR